MPLHIAEYGKFRVPSSRVAVLGIVLAGYLASLILNHPGHFEPDSLWQLEQGTTGVYNDWHPPVMAWLLGVAERIRHGASPFIVFNAALFFGGLAAIATLEQRPRLPVLPLLAILMASPLVLVYQGIVWKDILFANASMAGFSALAWAGKAWTHTLARYALLALAFSLFTLAALTRQNGFLVPLLGALALFATVQAMAAQRMGFSRRWLVSAAVHGVVALSIVGFVAAVISMELEAHGDGQPANPEHLKNLQAFDLAGVLHREPRLGLKILAAMQPDVERWIRFRAAPNYRAAGADNISELPDGEDMMAPPGDALGRQWLAMVATHPLIYGNIRTEVFRSTFLTPTSGLCPIIFVGIDGSDPSILRELRISARYNRRDRWADHYASMFTSTPVFSHLFYAVVLAAILVVSLRRYARGDRPPEGLAMMALGASAILFAASFFIISVACDYRYLYFLDVAAMAILVREVSTRPSNSVEVADFWRFASPNKRTKF